MTNKTRRPLREAVEILGGYSATSRIVGGTFNRVWKWLNISHIPHTEFSGATAISSQIENAVREKGGSITAAQILDYEAQIIRGQVVDPEIESCKAMDTRRRPAALSTPPTNEAPACQ